MIIVKVHENSIFTVSESSHLNYQASKKTSKAQSTMNGILTEEMVKETQEKIVMMATGKMEMAVIKSEM